METSHPNLYFREIIYHNPSAKKDSVYGVFSYEALTTEETRLGNLYLVGKIANFPPKKHKNFDFLLNLLASAIKRDFYSDPQRTTLEALESALQSANIYLADFAKRGHKEWIGNLDFSCLAFSQNNIHIGQTGNMLIYLSRGNTTSNIAKKFSNREKNLGPSKTFSNIASGSLEENDKVVIATLDILNIVPNQKIKELISYPSGEKLYNYLKEGLEAKKTNSLACLILEARSKPPIIEKETPHIEKTPKIISVDLERILNSKSNQLSNVVKNKITSSSNPAKFLVLILKYHILKYLLVLFLFLLIVLSPYIIQKINYDSKLKRVNNLIKMMREITRKSSFSLAYQNQSEAQAFIQRANTLINDASSLLKQLPNEAKEEPTQTIQSIQQDLNGQENSINNVINISQPEEITNLSKNTFSFNPQGILKLENNLYLYELSSGFLYKIDLIDETNHTLIFLSSKDTFKLGTVKDDTLALLSSPEKIYIYGKDDKYNTYFLKPSLENTINIKDMTNYGDSLYFLDTEKLNILKYTPQENSFSGINWLKKEHEQDLSEAQSITIDGSIYVSKLDGTIIEYLQGKKNREFKPLVSPPLNKGSRIFTDSKMKNLYILDPENRRIIALNKKDNLVIQYFSDKFDSLKNFLVAPDERTIYILNGSKVYRIDI